VTLAVGIAVALLAAGSPGHTDEAIGASAPARRVHLVSHGWHVGIVLGREDVATVSRLDTLRLGSFRYLEVGWGDGDFYPAPHGTLRLALRAAFCSRSSVLQVVGFDDEVTAMFPRSKILTLDLSPDGFAALARYVEAGYAVDDEGGPIVVAPAIYGSGAFYLARGRYRLLDNSNTWTARALKVAGCPIDVEATVTAGNLLDQAARCRWHHDEPGVR